MRIARQAAGVRRGRGMATRTTGIVASGLSDDDLDDYSFAIDDDESGFDDPADFDSLFYSPLVGDVLDSEFLALE